MNEKEKEQRKPGQTDRRTLRDLRSAARVTTVPVQDPGHTPVLPLLPNDGDWPAGLQHARPELARSPAGKHGRVRVTSQDVSAHTPEGLARPADAALE